MKNKNKQILNIRMIRSMVFLLLCVALFGCKHSDEDSKEPSNEDPAPVSQPDFMIAVIGDTQYYVENEGVNGQYIQGLNDQIDWIKEHRVDSNIVYVIGVGDIVEHGDHGHTGTGTSDSEWIRAKEAFYELENVSGLPDGIPYGLALGNHDFTPYGHNSDYTEREAKFYNQYFGRDHFAGRSYYGGAYGTENNNNHFGFFSAGGMDFVVIYIQFDQFNQYWSELNNWAATLMKAYPDRKAIVVTHHTVNVGDAVISPERISGKDGKRDFSAQAESLYNRLKEEPNFFMMFGGHVKWEGRRQDTHEGRTVKSYTVDYQGCIYPSGLLRTMKISVNNDRIDARTFLPTGGNCMHFTSEARCVGEGDSYTYTCESTRSSFTQPLFRSITTTRTCDFNNDGKSEPAFYDNGTWKFSETGDASFLPSSSNIPVPGDYDANGKTDIAVYRPVEGDWAVKGMGYTAFSVSGGIPVPGDYDGNGTTDFALFEPNAGVWHVKLEYLSTAITQQHGKVGDIPVPGDYDGDGKVDYAVFSPSTAEWSIYNISTGVFGKPGDVPVPGDYDGDGIIERAVYSPDDNTWYVEGRDPVVIGEKGDIPVPGNFNGNGATDIAVYRPTEGKIYLPGGDIIDTGYTNAKPLNLPYAVLKLISP
ncbi:MAG: metallophosphoesterase [Fulvivirga sp.]